MEKFYIVIYMYLHNIFKIHLLLIYMVDIK